MTMPGPLLAAFVTPGLFAIGSAMVAAPILIHLLARRRFKRIRWAAMDFLIDAERRNRRRVRMEELILLALRCLAVLALSLLVARPFLRPTGLAAALGGSRHTERIFVLDDSFSMGYRGEGDSSFDRAKVAIRRLIDAIRSESPDDTVSILRTSSIERPLESGVYLDDGQTDALLERLAGVQPSNRSMDLAGVIEGVADDLRRSQEVVSAAVYFISDFQRKDWSAANRESTGSGCFAPLEAWAGGERALRIVCINVGDDQAVNSAVTGLRVTSGALVAGTEAPVRATLMHHGGSAIENVTLGASVGQVAQAVKPVDELSPGQEVSVELPLEFALAGQETVRVELPADALPIDDARVRVVDVSSALRVLVVNGEPATDVLDDEVALLTTALRPEGDVFSGIESTVVDELEFESTTLDGFHAVVLANVYRMGEAAVTALEGFVTQGGGLLVFLGDQVDAEAYNSLLFRDGDGLLPVRLLEAVRPPDEVHLVITDALHPVLRGLALGGDPLGLGRIPFFGYFPCHPIDTSMDPAPKEGEEKSEQVPLRDVRVLATFDNADAAPAIVEGRFGRGQVVVVSTSVDKEWNLWPDTPVYLPVMNELVRHLSRSSAGDQEFSVGSAIEIPLDVSMFEPDAIVRTPGFPAEREIGVTAAPTGEGTGLVIRWEATDAPGVYQFVLRRREGGEMVRIVAVNPDPRESDLAACNEADVRRVAGSTNIDYVAGIDRLGGATQEGRIEFWRFVLVAALIVLMAEQGLAWRWGVRG